MMGEGEGGEAESESPAALTSSPCACLDASFGSHAPSSPLCPVLVYVGCGVMCELDTSACNFWHGHHRQQGGGEDEIEVRPQLQS